MWKVTAFSLSEGSLSSSISNNISVALTFYLSTSEVATKSQMTKDPIKMTHRSISLCVSSSFFLAYEIRTKRHWAKCKFVREKHTQFFECIFYQSVMFISASHQSIDNFDEEITPLCEPASKTKSLSIH